MKIIIVGATGTIGRAVHKHLSARGHTIITVGRTSGDIQCDITDETHIEELFAQVGQIDALVFTAGEVPYAPISELTAEDYSSAWTRKVLPQINLVRIGLNYLTPTGSFTLISGIPSRDPVVEGAAAATANGAIEAFVRSAAIEIAPRRINVVSPSVLTESLESFGDFFPGFAPVDADIVARGFQKAIEGPGTGHTITLP